ncbi:MAG TPA: capsule assembly Wzi family protein [Steroidobacteraceae bacterium]|nr:capsule assembly Wzi family protein [Steroidobacteraceae bacterium]
MSQVLRCIVIVCLLAAVAPALAARGVSPYLPLHLDPEIERQIERVLILGDKPVITRPIAAANVLDALPAACKFDAILCRNVRQYLERYIGTVGLDHASAEGASTDDVPVVALPDAHGMSTDSPWRVSALAHWQANDYVLLNLGGVAYDGGSVPTGSVLSVGFEYAQLDIGWRDHWFSPFTTSAMIMSTQAQTLPSITLSNYAPLTRFGLHYEVFLAEMEESDRIVFEDRFTSGNPRLAGLRFSIEPAPGWSLSANRMMQYGGGERGGNSFSDFLDALFKPHQNDNANDNLSNEEEFGNQVAAWTSRFIFPGPTPFAVYFEYAGEDNSYEGNFRLGNASLSVGITFPRLWRRFDLTYEASEWQNGWYTHHIYLDGLTNEGHVLGHWGADLRQQDDAVGAQTHLLRLGWEPPFGGLLELRARTIDNEDYGVAVYERGYDVGLAYSRGFKGVTFGVDLLAGRDVFGEDYSRLAGFVRFGDEWAGTGSALGDSDLERPLGAELFVEAGATASEVQIRLGDGSPKTRTDAAIAPHLGLGARRAVSRHSDLGVRLELDEVDGEYLLAVRAVDYRYRFSNPLALTAFAGAARYDLATPAYGYYIGAGMQWRDLLKGLDVNLDFKYADKVARDKLLPTDPGTDPRPDSFYDVTAATLSLSYRF